ncbi:MAG: class I SAM-dependent methyltransferase [Terriglobia bacterium]
MSWSDQFFSKFWPVVGPVFTEHIAETEQEVKSLLQMLRLGRRARILDVPCGFGRHAVELARHGFRVTGVDISPELLARAREAAAAQGVVVEFRRGDMRRLAYQREFDVVLNLLTSFGYFGDRTDFEVLRKFRRALRPKGRLVIDVINRDWIMRNFLPHDRARVGKFVVAQERSFDFRTSLQTTYWTARRGPRRWKGTTRLRLYSCHELLERLEHAGFSDVRCCGDLRGGPLTLDSPRLVLVARRFA